MDDAPIEAMPPLEDISAEQLLALAAILASHVRAARRGPALTTAQLRELHPYLADDQTWEAVWRLAAVK